MIQLEILRALAGIANSETMDKKVREQAQILMIKIMESLDKMVDVESAVIKKESAAMNGIIS